MLSFAIHSPGRIRIVLLVGLFWSNILVQERPAAAQLAIRAQPERDIVTVTLAERGLSSGVELRGVFDHRVIHLPTLAAALPERGRLRLLVEAQLPGWRRATLEVRVNERSLVARDLLQTPSGEWVLPLEPVELRTPYVRVELMLRGSLADDRCVDERGAAGFVRIGSRSGLELALDRHRIDDLWRLWESLPRRVEIAVGSSDARAETLHTALLVGLALARSGREILYRDLDVNTPLLATGVAELIPVAVDVVSRRSKGFEEPFSEPSIPHVVVGEPEFIRPRLEHLAALEAKQDGVTIVLSERGDLGVVRLGKTPIILIRPRAGRALDRLVDSGFFPLVAGHESGIAFVASRSEETLDTVPLAKLGADLGTRWIVERGGWRFELPLVRLPPRRIPFELVLDLLAPVPSGERPIVTGIWLDEELLHLAPLPAGPGPHRLRLRLPEGRTRLAPSVRIELLREVPSDPCTTRPIAMPAQLLPTSHLLLGPATDRPTSFAELAALFDAQTPILIARDVAEQPAGVLTTLTEIGRHLLRPGSPGLLQVIEPDRLPSVEGPFLLVGGRHWPELVAPLRLDRGLVRLVARASGSLLDIGPAAEDLTIAQVARLDDRPGLWLVGTGSGSLIWPGDRLDREDVAIGDRYGTRLAFRTTADRVVAIEYPEAISWFERFAFWRWGLILTFWMALTAVVVGILRRRPVDPGS